MSEKRDAEWCPEPWRMSGDTVLSADGSCVVESPWTCCEDDLRRIVAAVNAVAGIPTEALESGALGEVLGALSDADAALTGAECKCRGFIAADRFNCMNCLAREAVRAALRRLGSLP